MIRILRSMTVILAAFSVTNSFAADEVKQNGVTKPSVAIKVQPIKWENYTPDVFAKAAAVNHPVMLFIMADSCHWCHELQEKTFSNESVFKYINKNYYPVILHADVDSVAAEKYQVTGVPMIVLFDSDGKQTKIQEGFIDKDGMLMFLKPGIPGSSQK